MFRSLLLLVLLSCVAAAPIEGYFDEDSAKANEFYLASFSLADIDEACMKGDDFTPYTLMYNGTQLEGNLTIEDCTQLEENSYWSGLVMDPQGSLEPIEVICGLSMEGVCDAVAAQGEARSSSCSGCQNCCNSSSRRCFPGASKVLLEGGNTKMMKELKVGDSVQVVDPTTGELKFEKVYLFGHRQQDTVGEYVSLTTASAELQLSPIHYVHKAGAECDSVRCAETVPASWVKAGDFVFKVVDGETVKAEVLATKTTPQAGAYNPFTASGTIVVDGVVASVHSDWIFESILPQSMYSKIPALNQVVMSWMPTIYSFAPETVAMADEIVHNTFTEGWNDLSWAKIVGVFMEVSKTKQL